MTIIQVTNQSPPAARPARQRCDRCAGPFGLVTHRWWGSKFCKRRCKQAHLREIMLDRRRTIHRWCGFLARISLGRQAIPMIPRCARNRSWGLRSLVCAGLVLLVVAPVSKLEAGYCGQPFDVQAALIRWTNTRQSRPKSEEPDQICRSYFNQFYEAVQARQAVSECAGRGQQKDVEMLDGQIEAFNSLIATSCGHEN
jgi:hypothetical protein